MKERGKKVSVFFFGRRRSRREMLKENSKKNLSFSPSLTVRGVVPDPPRRLQLERVAVGRVAPVAFGVAGTVAAAANLFFFSSFFVFN